MLPRRRESRTDADKLAVLNFCEYLRIPTAHPNVNYESCIKFLTKQAEELDLPPPEIIYCFPNNPIILMTWTGQIPSLPSILLISHMDVVPVYEEMWTHPPFGAEMDTEENIYARGAQDSKCLGIQYLEAIRRLKSAGVTLMRTLHIAFMPDSKGDGTKGMKAFVNKKTFHNLNVEFVLGEGLVSADNSYKVIYGERCYWRVEFKCLGKSGHSSLFMSNTAAEKLNRLISIILDFQKQQMTRMAQDNKLKIGDVATVNITTISGGVQQHIVPADFTLEVDCRLPETMDIHQWENTLRQWCSDAGEGVTFEYLYQSEQTPSTILDDSNPFWTAFKTAATEMKLKINSVVDPAKTDSRFLRRLGLPCIGFSPINNTPFLLHDHDEFINVNTFLKGIEIVLNIINAVANVP